MAGLLVETLKKPAAPDLQFLDQLWHSSEQIGDQPKIRDLKDGCFFVFVDGDDDFAVFHSGKVLDRARDADRYVQIGGDNFAGLANLPIIGGIAAIHSGAGCANGGTQFVCQFFDQGKIVLRTDTAAARNNNPS